MTSLETVAERHARRQKALAQRAAAQSAKLWAAVDSGNIAASWRELVPSAAVALSTSQATAAASAGIYIEDALEAQSVFAGAEGRVMASAFAGVASDGRPLASLLYEPAVRALVQIQQGNTLSRARAAGQLSLDTIVRTQVADAGRTADAVAIAARPAVKGFVRMLSAPSCSRCIILAGRWYRWNAGFKRHPRCDCRAVPAQENAAGDVRTDPKKLYESMSDQERKRVFGVAGSKALDEGADMAKVVNANRGVYEVSGKKFTHEAAGRRRRLMPEEIFREAKGDRQEAIRLLRLHGFLK